MGWITNKNSLLTLLLFGMVGFACAQGVVFHIPKNLRSEVIFPVNSIRCQPRYWLIDTAKIDSVKYDSDTLQVYFCMEDMTLIIDTISNGYMVDCAIVDYPSEKKIVLPMKETILSDKKIVALYIFNEVYYFKKRRAQTYRCYALKPVKISKYTNIKKVGNVIRPYKRISSPPQ